MFDHCYSLVLTVSAGENKRAEYFIEIRKFWKLTEPNLDFFRHFFRRSNLVFELKGSSKFRVRSRIFRSIAEVKAKFKLNLFVVIFENLKILKGICRIGLLRFAKRETFYNALHPFLTEMTRRSYPWGHHPRVEIYSLTITTPKLWFMKV